MKIKKFVFYLIIIPISCGVSCGRNASSSTNTCARIPSIDEISSYLGCHIDSLPDFSQFIKHKVIVTGDEDNSLHWFSLDYQKDDKLILSLESNWVNPEIITRITIWDTCIRDGNIYVGQKIGKIRNLINFNIPSSPDGEMFVTVKNRPSMYLQLVADKEDWAYKDALNLEEISDSLRINLIILR